MNGFASPISLVMNKGLPADQEMRVEVSADPHKVDASIFFKRVNPQSHFETPLLVSSIGEENEPTRRCYVPNISGSGKIRHHSRLANLPRKTVELDAERVSARHGAEYLGGNRGASLVSAQLASQKRKTESAERVSVVRQVWIHISGKLSRVAARPDIESSGPRAALQY